MDNQLDKILNLVKRTGDKVVVLKNEVEFVVSSLDDYYNAVSGNSNFSDLSEQEMLNKINRDIALWRESQRELALENEPSQYDIPMPVDVPYYQDINNNYTQQEIDRLSDHIFADKSDQSDQLDFKSVSPSKVPLAMQADLSTEDLAQVDNWQNENEYDHNDDYNNNDYLDEPADSEKEEQAASPDDFNKDDQRSFSDDAQDEFNINDSKPFKEDKINKADRKSTRLNSSHTDISRMPSSA